MEEGTANPVSIIRTANRSDLRDVRDKHKEMILYNKRLRLDEVSDYIHDVNISEFKKLLLKLKQKNVPLVLLKKIKNSCVSCEYIEAIFRTEGAFNSLLRMLLSNDAHKQLEAAACLTNLTCGPHIYSYKVAKNAGAYFTSFVNGNNLFLQEQSAWALANIATDCLECFNIIKSQGALPALLKAMTSPLQNVVHSVLFALCACTKYEDPEIISLIQKDLPNCVLSTIEQDNISKDMFLDAVFTLSNCCYLSMKYSLNTFDTKSLERIITMLLKVAQSSDIDRVVAIPLVRSIGYLSYDDSNCNYLSSHTKFYQAIQNLASAEDCMHLFKESVWILCNVAASADYMVNASNIMPLFDPLKTFLKQEKSVILQVLYYLATLLSRSEDLIFPLKQHEIFVEIQSLLESTDKDILQASRIILEIMQQP